MSWVWEHSQATGNDRLVLLAIADTAHDDGTSAFPKSATIQRKCGGISERTVSRCVARLVELNELFVEAYGKGREPSRYRVLMIVHDGTGVNEGGQIVYPEGGQSDAPAPSECLPGVDTGDHPAPSDCPPGVDTSVYPLREPSFNQEPEPKELRPAQAQPTATDKDDNASKSNGTRGLRLPADWRPSAADIAWQRGEQIGDDEARRETEKFRDYWHSRAGAAARKLDWSLTWRNWIRKAIDDRNNRRSAVAEPVFDPAQGRTPW